MVSLLFAFWRTMSLLFFNVRFVVLLAANVNIILNSVGNKWLNRRLDDKRNKNIKLQHKTLTFFEEKKETIIWSPVTKFINTAPSVTAIDALIIMLQAGVIMVAWICES